MDLNRRLDGRGSNRSWAGWDFVSASSRNSRSAGSVRLLWGNVHSTGANVVVLLLLLFDYSRSEMDNRNKFKIRVLL